MRLTQKKIEEIMRSVIGEEGLPLVKELSGRENVSEFELGDRLKKDIKIVRKMLYLLYNYNLVSFIRKKDKIKGWYIYYWTLLPESIRFNYVKRKKELLARLQQRLEDESRELFYICPNKCVRLDFDQSMDFEFHCSECGELTSQEDNAERLKILRKKISELEKELEELLEKRKTRKKTAKVRKKKVKLRKLEKRKTGKSSTKKITKIKPKKIGK
ncbi:MAG: hypothetical protein AABX64_00580 [Nanoarchaeota archaeon]